jgi:hypothetical protein
LRFFEGKEMFEFHVKRLIVGSNNNFYLLSLPSKLTNYRQLIHNNQLVCYNHRVSAL